MQRIATTAARTATAIRSFAILVVGVATVGFPPSMAIASQAEAKEAARLANCKPGKIEVLRSTTGRTGETVYKVECQGQKDSFVLVRCQGRLCTLAR